MWQLVSLCYLKFELAEQKQLAATCLENTQKNTLIVSVFEEFNSSSTLSSVAPLDVDISSLSSPGSYSSSESPPEISWSLSSFKIRSIKLPSLPVKN